MSSMASYPPAAQILPDIPVQDTLARKPNRLWSVEPDASVYSAIELMAEARVGALLVLHAGKLLGILSERDYARKVILVGRSSRVTRVRAIMTVNVITVAPDANLQNCMQLMTNHRIRHLPVVDEGQVVGMVSIGDVVREIIAQQSHALDELRRYVTGEPRLTSERTI
jgi:signal-transduction protein with cAMP-binding, CBS, and nucleotidyltransferase domain